MIQTKMKGGGGGTAKAKIRRRGDLRLAIATTKISSKHIHGTRRQACGLYPQTIGIVLRVAPSFGKSWPFLCVKLHLYTRGEFSQMYLGWAGSNPLFWMNYRALE